MGVGPAWDLACGAASSAGVAIEPVETFDQILEACAVISAVWGDEAAQAHYLRAIQHAGNVFLGARARREMVGFVVGLLGSADGLHVHSHMLAVLPGWRSRSVGYALKLAQRAATLDAGVGEVRWTFDPMVARNAGFNLRRLGAVATAWMPNFYGDMADEINRGERSDRFEVRWILTSERVERILEGRRPPVTPGDALVHARGSGDSTEPVVTGALPTPGCTVAVPGDHVSLRAADAALARRWRDACAGAFEACFARGLVASWITDDGRYVFEGRAG